MSEFLRDMALRALLVAVVSALASGGVVWFIVDQSLRGLEAALVTTNTRVSDIITRVDTSIATTQTLGDRLDLRLGAIEDKLDLASAQDETIKVAIDGARAADDAQDRDFLDSLTLTRRLLEALAVSSGDTAALAAARAEYLTLCGRATGRMARLDSGACRIDF